jgi:segregation and condensation protein A
MDNQQTVTSEFCAMVDGRPYTQVPDDLFIPPDALEVLLDSFTGPLDLLLYLIRKQNLDILNIPIVQITEQYLQYIDMMEFSRLELAAEYLLMAAMLAEIKSRLLLPIVPSENDEEDADPRMALVRRLQAYEQIKQAAEWLDALPRSERDHFSILVKPSVMEEIMVHPDVSLQELIAAMKNIMQREQHLAHHEIARELLSVRERMNSILDRLQQQNIVEFSSLFPADERRMGLVVTFLAVLELAKQSLLIINQSQAFAPIYLQAA